MNSGVCENVNNTTWTKNCLLKYIVEPFIKDNTWQWHQNLWQAKELAKIIGEFSYNVDVTQYNDPNAQLNKKYDLLIDNYPQNIHLYNDFLAEDCLKVYYSTTAGPAWQYRQERERLDALYARRGVRLPPRFDLSPYDRNIDIYDAMFLFGNEFTPNTYAEFHIPKVFLIKNTGYASLAGNNLTNKDPRTFLFFASHTQVLKGLDLLLEVFAQNKELNLIICSNFKPETEFCKVYEKELFQSSNIISLGFIDIASELFKKITQVASFVVLPSCTEGMAGSVLTAMSAGLIPIISRWCGLAEDEAIYFEDCSIECISQTLTHYSKQSEEWIAAQSLQASHIVQTRYSPADYSASIRLAMQGLLQYEG